MNVFPLHSKTDHEKQGEERPTHYFNTNDYLRDPESGIYVEDYFNEMLCLERKRTERSKKPFLLMLLDLDELIHNGNGRGVLSRITNVLHLSTRETDLKGWYKEDSTLGIICSEICENDTNLVKDQIYTKVFGGLSNVLNLDQLKRIKVSFHLFPEKHEDSDSFNKPDPKLYPDLLKKYSSDDASGFFKRALDIVGSLLIIMLFLPIYLAICILIKLTSKGPILFKQERVGQFGKSFTFLKFRSMYVNNDSKIHQEYIKKYISQQACYKEKGCNGAEDGNIYKVMDDPRITPIGRFLRKTSLDELPQCFNVLKGDMSLVGPRPPIAYEIECYDVWHRRRILEMKPGITGLWQVNGRNRTSFDEMVRLDLRYTREWSLWLDIKILLQTPWVAFMGKTGY